MDTEIMVTRMVELCVRGGVRTHKTHARLASNPGIILLATLTFGFIMLLILASGTRMVFSLYRMGRAQGESTQAYYLAEAGEVYGRYLLRHTPEVWEVFPSFPIPPYAESTDEEKMRVRLLAEESPSVVYPMGQGGFHLFKVQGAEGFYGVGYVGKSAKEGGARSFFYIAYELEPDFRVTAREVF